MFEPFGAGSGSDTFGFSPPSLERETKEEYRYLHPSTVVWQFLETAFLAQTRDPSSPSGPSRGDSGLESAAKSVQGYLGGVQAPVIDTLVYFKGFFFETPNGKVAVMFPHLPRIEGSDSKIHPSEISEISLYTSGNGGQGDVDGIASALASALSKTP